MTLAIKREEAWVELTPGLPVMNNDGIVASWGTIQIWNEVDKNSFGVYTVQETPQSAEGKIAVPQNIEDVDGKPVRKYKYVNAPTPNPVINYIPTYMLRQRAQNAGIWDDLSAYLVQYPALMLKVLTLETGVDPKDPDLLAGFNTLNVPQSVQDYLLSDPSLGV